MSAVVRRRITLPADQAEYIDTLVAAGAFASARDVVKAGLEALQDREKSLDQWLIEEVAPTYDAMQADPERGMSAEEVRRAVTARAAARSTAPKRGS
jgi:antitoxin ParD1/3/4